MFCGKCGNEIKEGENFCSKCGTKVNNPAPSVDEETENTSDEQLKKDMKKYTKIVLIGIPVIVIALLGLSFWITNASKPSADITKPSIKVETEEEKQARIKEQENNDKVEKIITEWAEYVRNSNKGSVKYKSHKKYTTANNGKIIYMIIYDTGSKYSEYRQLVAIDENLTEIKGTTKLYYYTYLSDGRAGANDEQKLKWEAEQLWGI